MAEVGRLFVAFFLFYVTSASVSFTVARTPIVLWHGMGDTCCNPISLGAIENIIKKEIPGVYIRSIQIGTNFMEDFIGGYFGHVDTQVSEVCRTLSADTKLRGGFHAVGFSQGGQFLRAVVQRCGSPIRVHNLVSIGGQHQGVFGLPHCPGNDTVCAFVRKLLDREAYATYVQDHIVQAQYWHSPLEENVYRAKSAFLAELNEENRSNATYRRRMASLRNFVMVKFLRDSMVVPKESEWFGFYKPGQASAVYALRNSTFYAQNKLSLKTLDANKRLHFLECDADHLQMTRSWFIRNIIHRFLK